MADEIRVLYVTSDPRSAARLERAVGASTVTIAASVGAALDRLDEGIDCVVSDHDLPDGDGVTLLERLRERRPALPFVLFPTAGSETLASAAIDAGVSAYVPGGSPDRYDALAERVEELAGASAAPDDDAADGEESALLEQLLKTSPVGVVVLDADGRIERANARAEEIIGATSAELTGRTYDDLGGIVDADGTQLSRDELPFKRILAADGDRDVVDFKHGVETPDGERRWLSVNASSLRNAEGEVERVVATVTDATERHRRERTLEALHDTTRQFMQTDSKQSVGELAVEATRMILDLPISGVWLYDADDDCLRPVAWTDDSAALVGEHPVYSGEESLSWQVFQNGGMRFYDDLTAESGRYDSDSPIESEIALPLGDHGVMNIGATESGAFDDADVALARLLATHTEVALERADRKIERRAHVRELERQNERLDEFASVISHDLRNPLGVARGRLELLESDCDSQHIEPLDQSLDRMDAIIEDVLVLAQRGRLVGDTERVDLSDVAEAAWGTVETGRASLVREGSCRIDADFSRLQQLLENLFHNAVKHAGSDATVRIGPLDGQGFYVADDGPGIPADERSTVFDLGHSTAADGTGFGLNIVEQIAEAHGWTVGITAGEDGGARFEITLRDAA